MIIPVYITQLASGQLLPRFTWGKSKYFIHPLSNFHEFQSTVSLSAMVINRSGSEGLFEVTSDQLLPQCFKIALETIIFCVECSYLKIK